MAGLDARFISLLSFDNAHSIHQRAFIVARFCFGLKSDGFKLDDAFSRSRMLNFESLGEFGESESKLVIDSIIE